MESLGLWIQPALMLPGVGLLLMSTITRFGQVEAQLQYAVTHAGDGPQLPTARLNRCEQLLRIATVCLYGSVSALAFGSLIGGLTVSSPDTSRLVVLAAVCVAVALVVLASILLILESGRAVGTKPQLG